MGDPVSTTPLSLYVQAPSCTCGPLANIAIYFSLEQLFGDKPLSNEVSRVFTLNLYTLELVFKPHSRALAIPRCGNRLCLHSSWQPPSESDKKVKMASLDFQPMMLNVFLLFFATFFNYQMLLEENEYCTRGQARALQITTNGQRRTCEAERCPG